MKWIKVNERLPEDEGEYLIYNEDQIIDTIFSGMEVSYFEKRLNLKGTHWTNISATCLSPTHWAELPQPPKDLE